MAHRSTRGLAMVVLVFASFMDLVDVTIVQVALPTIRTDLHATPAALEWIVSGYMLAFAIVLVTGGRLGDIYGRKRIFIIGMAGFTLASIGASTAATGEWLVLFRVLQGGCAALMVPQGLASLQALFAPKERAPIYGVMGGISGLAAVISPPLGGWLVASDAFGLGWRSIFLINVPVGIVTIVAAIFWVPNTRSEHPLRLDFVGVVLSAAGVFLVVYPLIEGRSLGWPGWIWGMLGAGILVLAVFAALQVRRERRTGSALLPMRLFRNSGFTFGLLTQAAFQGALNAFSIILLLYVQSALGFSALGAGLTLLPFSLGAFIGTGVSVPLGAKLGKVLMFAGGVLQAGSVAWVGAIVVAEGRDLSGWNLVVPMAIAGIGLGLLVVPLVDVALARVPVPMAGAATGAYSTFQQVGAALGVAIVGLVFFGRLGTDYSFASFQAAFSAAIWVGVIGFGIAALSSLLLPGRAAVQAHKQEEDRILADA